MRRLSNILIVMVIAMVSHSCMLRPMDDDCICTTAAAIPIHIDWTRSGVTPKNVSVLAYDKASGKLVKEHTFGHNDREIQSYIYLPIGEYTIVIFNELRNQIEYVQTRGHEQLSTLSFVTKIMTQAIVRSESLSYIQEPGGLAVEVIEDMNVTQDLILYTTSAAGDVQLKSDVASRVTSEALMNVTPSNKISKMNLTVHVDGLKNARMPALVDLMNVSEGYSVSEDRNLLSPAMMQFTVGNPKYNAGSKTDGTVSTTISLFGTLGDRFSTADHDDTTPIMVNMLFMLVDAKKTIEEFEVDVTDLIEFRRDGDGLAEYTIDGELVLNLDLYLDRPLPDVVPEGSGNSGFGSALEDWTIIDVPLING